MSASLRTGICFLIREIYVWRLFFFTVETICHNPCWPVVHTKESYDNTKLLLSCIQHHKYSLTHQWKPEIHSSSIRHSAWWYEDFWFFCKRGGKARSSPYGMRELSVCEQFLPRQKNFASDPILGPQKIFLPPLHTKLAQMKNSVRATSWNTEGL